MNLGALIGIPPATVRCVTHVVPNESRGAQLSLLVPVVFVVDGEISVRESLELMVRCEGFTHGKLRGRYVQERLSPQ